MIIDPLGNIIPQLEDRLDALEKLLRGLLKLSPVRWLSLSDRLLNFQAIHLEVRCNGPKRIYQTSLQLLSRLHLHWASWIRDLADLLR